MTTTAGHGSDELLAEVDETRLALREEARRTLGVTGEESPGALRT